MILKIILENGVETQELINTSDVADITSLVELYTNEIFKEGGEVDVL